MVRELFVVSAIGLSIGVPGAALAAPDWGKVPGKSITVFYPGAAPMEWIMKGGDHSGAKGIKKGETCIACHEEELADMGKKMASGQKIEPSPIKGKTGSVPVTVQAAFDAAHLYLRFSWKQPPGGGPKMDKDNPVKLAFMPEDNKVEHAAIGGCWATCHNDLRTMPGVTDDKKTKYIKDANIAGGKFYDLIQWTSKGKSMDGCVADKRVMEGGKALVSADGKNAAGAWTVTVTRKLAGGDCDVALAAGKTYNFGFAIHDDHTKGRFHFVSMGYSLGLGAKADIEAVKQ